MVVTVHLCTLAAATPELAAARALLSDAERTQADGYRFDADRRRFIVRRALLRHITASYLGEQPERVTFGTNAHGKPCVAGGPQFSLSYSRDMAMIAIGDMPLGCDIEWRDPSLASPEIARRFFAPAEIAALDALPAMHWLGGFFDCWARKEAYVKAIGEGLSHPLDGFEVSVAPEQPARLLKAQPGWSIHGFMAAPGLHAAIVATGETMPELAFVSAAAPAVAA